ncbi:MAG: translocation/assembly module TamB domain-containing protein [Pseudohongiellaceae bacterium]
MSVLTGKLRRYLAFTLITLLLLILLVAATVSTFLATETGSRTLVNFALAQANSLEDIDVTVGEIRGNLLQGLQLGSLQFSAAGVIGSVDRLALAWSPNSLFAGRVLLTELQLQTVRVEMPPAGEPPAEAQGDPLADFAFTPLPVAIAIDELRVSDLEIVMAGQTTVVSSIAMSAGLVGQRLQIEDLALRLEALRVDGAIDLTLDAGLPIAASLDWRYEGELPLGFEAADGALDLTGSLQELTVAHSLNEPFAIASNGTVTNPASALALDLVHESESIALPLESLPLQLDDLRLVMSGSPEDMALTVDADLQTPGYPRGTLNASGHLQGDTLDLTELQLATDSGSLTGATLLSWGDGVSASGGLQVEDLQPLRFWQGELPATIADVTASARYDLTLGDADTRTVAVELQSLDAVVNGYGLQAEGQAQLLGDRLQIERLQVESNSNSVTISGEYQDRLDIEWQIDALALTEFMPGLSGSLQGSGHVSGDPAQPDIDGELTLASLRTDSFSVQNLALSVAGSDGDYRLDMELTDADLPDNPVLAEIRAAQASLSGTLTEHSLVATVEGNTGTFELRVSGGLEAPDSRNWRGRLERARLVGEVGEWRLGEPVAVAWNDQRLSVDRGCWRQESVGLCFAVAPDADGNYDLSGSLENFPLEEFNDEREGGHIIALPAVPRLPEAVSLNGTVNAELTARFGPDIMPEFEFDARSQAPQLALRSLVADGFGSVTSEAEILEQVYVWQELALTGTLAQGRWQLRADAQLVERRVRDIVDDINGNLTAGLEIAPDGSLSGASSARFEDLGWIAAFIPELSAVNGNLQSELDIAGSIDSPVVTGAIGINDGSFLVDRTGVFYQDLQVQLASDDFETATIEGGVASEEGRLTFSGQLDELNTAGWRFTGALDGEDLQLADLPDLQMSISPALDLTADAGGVQLRGDILVPLLDLYLRELPESAVDISRDVVIVNFPEDRPELARSFTTGQTSIMNLPLIMDINLRLGDDVRFNGFGLQAKLDGALSIQQSRNGRSLTYGDLTVTEGQYEIYGQTLILRQGKLLFLGNYQNPAVDIRAVREVESMIVGVQMNGTINNLRSELFSTPTLPESDIISVLVTGRPVSELQSGEGASVLGAITTLGLRQSEAISQQVGDTLGLDTVAITNSGDVDSSELVVGKYLTPDLFIRYGVGLFDRASKVSVEYSINERFTLQAESGEYQSLDLNYKVER